MALGVPVDNTTGTAAITAANIRGALGLASANLDAQLAAIPTTAAPSASTIATAVWAVATSALTTAGTIGKLLADNINATISSAVADSSGVTTLLGRLTSGRASALDNLDATVSSRSTYAGGDTSGTTTLLSRLTSGRASALDNLDATVSSRLAASGYTTPPTASAIASAVNSALDRTGFSLTTTERQAIATAVEQSILNENDGQAILNAIVGAIGNTNVDQVALVAAIRADLERAGGTLATRLAASAYTAPLDAAATRSAVGLSAANLDTQLSGISSGISGLPSAAVIASAVWAAATRTLTTAIDNSATIAAAVWSYATGRTITGGTVDTLTNAPSVPSAAQIAGQVRTELSAELSRIDANVSSRLAPGGTLSRVTLVDTTTTLTNAPDVPTEAEIATAVRTELAPELARVANAATTQEVGDIVEAALQPLPET